VTEAVAATEGLSGMATDHPKSGIAKDEITRYESAKEWPNPLRSQNA
jgi:hypothetical protein